MASGGEREIEMLRVHWGSNAIWVAGCDDVFLLSNNVCEWDRVGHNAFILSHDKFRARETKKALNEFLFAVCGTCASASARQSGAQCCAREGLNSFCGRASPVPKEKRKTKRTSAGPLSEHNSAFDIRAVRERIEGDRAKDEEATRLKHSLRPSVARRGGEAGPAASPGPAPLPPRGEARCDGVSFTLWHKVNDTPSH